MQMTKTASPGCLLHCPWLGMCGLCGLRTGLCVPPTQTTASSIPSMTSQQHGVAQHPSATGATAHFRLLVKALKNHFRDFTDSLRGEARYCGPSPGCCSSFYARCVKLLRRCNPPDLNLSTWSNPSMPDASLGERRAQSVLPISQHYSLNL